MGEEPPSADRPPWSSGKLLGFTCVLNGPGPSERRCIRSTPAMSSWCRIFLFLVDQRVRANIFISAWTLGSWGREQIYCTTTIYSIKVHREVNLHYTTNVRAAGMSAGGRAGTEGGTDAGGEIHCSERGRAGRHVVVSSCNPWAGSYNTGLQYIEPSGCLARVIEHDMQ